jgi:hypothetical protein
MENAEKANEAWGAIASSLRGIRDDMGAAFGPNVVHGVEAIQDFLDDKENIEAFKTGLGTISDAFAKAFENTKRDIEDIKAIYNWIKSLGGPGLPQGLVDSLSGKTRAPNLRPRAEGSPLGPLSPTSPSDVDKTIRKPVTDGVVEGLKQFFDSKNINPKSGYKPISFDPDGGSGFGGGGSRGGGYFGSKEFPAVGGDGDGAGGGGPTGVNPALGGSMPKSVGGGSPALPSGSKAENAQRIYDELRRLGHTHEQASGALGHVQAESGFNPKATGDAGTAHGFFQHRGSRWASAMRDAAKAGTTPFSPEAAARHFDRELRNEESRAGRQYFNSKSTQDAVTALNSYERFAGWQRGHSGRYSAANRFSRTMKPSAPPAVAGNAPPSVSGSGGEPTFQERWDDRVRRIDKPAAGPQSNLDLLDNAKRSGLGGPNGGGLNGTASLTIDLNGFPRGTRTATSHEGLFKEVTLNRGRPMSSASEVA